MGKACMNCRKYDRYYSLGSYYYSKVNYGYCREKKEVIEMHEFCDCWVKKMPSISRNFRRYMCKEHLNKVAEDIRQIRCILFNDQEDEKEEDWGKDLEEREKKKEEQKNQ